jgi:uncharacterized protein (DUF58 family)
MQIRLRQRAFPYIIALLFIIQINQASRPWSILFFALTGLFVISWFWTRTLGHNISVRRETRLGWVHVGSAIEERITLSNASLMPAAWADFIDRSTLPDFDGNHSTSISAGSFDQWIVHASCNQRGLFSLGDALIQTGDPFGIFDVTIHASQRTSLLVLPRVSSLPEFSITPAGSYGDGKPRRNALQQSVHVSTVREFAQGDGVRQIHWPTTARTQKVHVRLMESAPEGDWWILLDLHERAMIGRGWHSVEEQSVALAASLAEYGLRSRKSVGLVTNSEEAGWVQPGKGGGQRFEILQALALAKPGDRSLTAFLERMHPSLGRHHSLIVITASTTTSWLKTIPSLLKRGIVPTVILMDPSTFGSDESMAGVQATLTQRGVRYHLVPNGLISPPQQEENPSAGKWTWRATASGFMPIRN